ncbi:uncharacterized protein LOC132394636 [Hypanus sabinus]|uniref:uncharacterized protein LOC132394636 n=1 Tax=Hypanus sabinus TaxID=79690 RepID=UPI0028C49A7C|nr:uncharacterized protein LOC132394636 [Hypanus sabinus]
MAHDGKNLVCEISGVGVPLNAQTSQLLDIQYQPLILSGPNCTRLENWIKCICKVKAKPTATITWSVNGSRIYFHVTNRTFENFIVQSSLKLIPQSGARQLLSCVAINLHGTSNGTYYLQTPVSGSLLRVVAIVTGAVTIIVIVILSAVFAYRKMRNTSPFDAHADMPLEEVLHRITEKTESASNLSIQSANLTYAAVSISRLPRNERHHQNEENTEYAAISFK